MEGWKREMGSRVFVLDDQRRILLVEMEDRQNGGTFWIVPDGRIEDGEHAVEGARQGGVPGWGPTLSWLKKVRCCGVPGSSAGRSWAPSPASTRRCSGMSSGGYWMRTSGSTIRTGSGRLRARFEGEGI
jgi:hypothetical protein